MTLESTIICVDNSEFCRNGDFGLNRLISQQDAANLVARTKLKSNPENDVGLLTMSDNYLVTTLTADQQKFQSVMAKVQPEGEVKLSAAVRVAQLSLKHRMHKNHRQRIVVFICSPILEDEKDLIKVAKRLKKEKVNLDIVSFGEDEANQAKLTAFINTLNGKDGSGSHLVRISSGNNLDQALRQSPIIGDDGPVGGAFAMDDAETDPELAMALRISLEEQRARQDTDGGAEQENTGAAAPAETEAMDEDRAMLNAALSMSMGGGAPAAASNDEPNFAAMTEEEQIAYALRMSMSDSAQAEEPAASNAPAESMDTDQNAEELVTDPEFLRSIIETLPEVDPNSDAVKGALGEKKKEGDDDKPN